MHRFHFPVKPLSFIILLLFLLPSISLAGCSDDKPATPQDPPAVSEPENPEPNPQDPEPEDPEPAEEIPAQYRLATLEINTEGGAGIYSKTDYINATISLSHDADDWNFSDVAAGIRGRGNSTWEWYPKKPYRIKFDKKQEVMGLDAAKSWVLLAEYRDPTDLMNAFVFELGHLMGLPFTNHNRYVWLILNGEEKGLYHLTEQVQQGKTRVNIDEKAGYLILLDKDDGPELSPYAGDNFWSRRYSMPVCIKNPEDLSSSLIDEVRNSLGDLEDAIASGNYDNVDRLLDISSMIDFIMIQELIYNVELDAPRSMYMHKDVGEKWVMGPLWDFDAGFDFDWTDMTHSHKYFTSYKELVLGTDPAAHRGTSYRVPEFFSDLFKIERFKTEYKARWKEVAAMVPVAFDEAHKYYEANTERWKEDGKLWPIHTNTASQISLLKTWLTNRVEYLDGIVDAY